MIKYFINEILLSGYEAAKEAGVLRVIRRYSRRNTSVQNGNIIDDKGLRNLRAEGDRAAAYLRRVMYPRAKPATNRAAA